MMCRLNWGYEDGLSMNPEIDNEVPYPVCK